MKSIRITVFLILVLIGLIVWIERADCFSFLDDESLVIPPSASVNQEGA
ncbi:MAG: hypothetical protein PHP44_15935 [Kiritimatiellae bacterium]|nr:hypothetical protein [Kiritimatiellia bacterium]